MMRKKQHDEIVTTKYVQMKLEGGRKYRDLDDDSENPQHLFQ